MYHIHDNTKWLPLISDPDVKHPKIKEIEAVKNDIPLEEIHKETDLD
jgi:hypothetical protein